LTLLLCPQKVLGSNLGPEAGYSERFVVVFRSVLKYTTHITSPIIIYNNTAIQRYTTQAAEKRYNNNNKENNNQQ